MTSVRCPASGCGRVFRVSVSRLGRSGHCPHCATRLTLRPRDVALRLADQQARIGGGRGATVPRLPLVALVDDVRSLWNVGSIFRTADGCGVAELVLCGITGFPPRPEIAKTGLGAEQAVRWRYRADAREALDSLRERGFEPVALESTPHAVPIDGFEWPARPCLVIGNEVAGVSPELLEASPWHVRIPMLGVKDSLNVAVAFGIAAYDAARELRRRSPASERGIAER